MHPQIISQEQNLGDPLTACISGVRKRRIKDDSYKWVDSGAKGWGWKRQREGEIWGALCMNNSRKPWERAVLEIQWNGLYFPAGPVVKIPSSQCRGPGFNP